jgi:hypothetical protein
LAAANGWLTVTVKATANTGCLLPTCSPSGISSATPAGSDSSFRINALDLGAVKRALNNPSDLAGYFDFNRDGRTNALDLGIVKANLNRPLLPLPPASAPTRPSTTHNGNLRGGSGIVCRSTRGIDASADEKTDRRPAGRHPRNGAGGGCDLHLDIR